MGHKSFPAEDSVGREKLAGPISCVLYVRIWRVET